MSEANPDPSGTTGEFRAFVEKGEADHRGGLRNPVVAIVALAVIVAIVVIVIALH